MEYQVVYLDRDLKLSHDESQVPILETDNLAIACSLCYKKFKEEGLDIAVYQPRTEGYREIYQKKRRKANGQFSTFEESTN